MEVGTRARPLPAAPSLVTTREAAARVKAVHRGVRRLGELDSLWRVVAAAPSEACRSVGVDRAQKVRGQKVSFIEAPTVCPSAGLPFLATFTYMDGSRGSSAKTISCTLNAV